MKVKVSEATDIQLDWMVAKADGHIRPDGGLYAGHHGRVWHPTTDWAQGGPIIEREKIGLSQITHESSALVWVASAFSVKRWGYGPTPLIAAMRCFCVAKLGDEVEVPEELV